MNSTEFNLSTPKLQELFAAMNAANDALTKITRKYIRAGKPPMISEEYKIAKIAYRAYWNEVDAKKTS